MHQVAGAIRNGHFGGDCCYMLTAPTVILDAVRTTPYTPYFQQTLTSGDGPQPKPATHALFKHLTIITATPEYCLDSLPSGAVCLPRVSVR